jgi:hypothetical protein
MSFTCESTGSWWMMSRNAVRRFTSIASWASALARSKRKPSTWASITQYRSESVMSCSTRGFNVFRVLPHPVKSE